jgi:hypothetical protein
MGGKLRLGRGHRYFLLALGLDGRNKEITAHNIPTASLGINTISDINARTSCPLCLRAALFETR